jgi:hypothetical protein
VTIILIPVGIVVVILGTIVLVTLPVRQVEAVARGFTWRRSARIGVRVWVRKKSKRQPRTANEIRNVKIRNADRPNKLRYTYQERVWRYSRSVSESGSSQETVRDPQYTLRMNEEVRGKSESYEARFVSDEGENYSAKIPFAQWKSLKSDAKYQLGRNTFGRVRTIKPARLAVNQRPPERT